MTNRHIFGSPEARVIVFNATASGRKRLITNNLLLPIFLLQGKDPWGVSLPRSSILLEKKGLFWSLAPLVLPCAALNQPGSILSLPPSQGSWRHPKELFFPFLSPGWIKAFSLHIFQMCCVTAHYSSLSTSVDLVPWSQWLSCSGEPKVNTGHHMWLGSVVLMQGEWSLAYERGGIETSLGNWSY